MNSFLIKILFVSSVIIFNACKKEDRATVHRTIQPQNTIGYAKGFELRQYKGYSILKVTAPWPDASKVYSYILKEKEGIVPDSLHQFPVISVPVQSIVVTSTTHIPALEMLGVENTLVGFPFTEYISSGTTRKRIDAGKVKEVGNSESLNTEVLIDLAPEVIVGHGIDDKNPVLDQLQSNGLNVLLNGDWNEQTPLGKAEWIKFFGALYGMHQKADSLFTVIVTEYKTAQKLAAKASAKPTVFSGALYKDQWYLPEGKSWAAGFISDAHATYLWSETTGTGSLSTSFETVLDRAQQADFWIGAAQFSSLNEMAASNPHYRQFAAFQNKKVYSSTVKKGATGGVLYFELSPSRPDIVLKDIIKIIHPELLPDHSLFFFQKLE